MATPDDAAAVAAVYAPYVTDTVISFEYEPPDAVAMRERISQVTALYPWLVMEDSDGLAGYVYAGAHSPRDAYRWSVDVAVYLHRRAHRQGYARQLYTAMFELLRAQGFVTAYAGISLPNEGSVGLHEAMGFTLVGVYPHVGFKQGQWWDVGWWQLELVQPPERPTELVPCSALPPEVLKRALER